MSRAQTLSKQRHRSRGLLSCQLRYEQLAFWRNPAGATFTIGFSLVFLLLVASSVGNQKSSVIGGIRIIQYYVPAFAAYGVMSACFNVLGIQLVVRREVGLLKRLRLSPLPTWALFGGIFLSSALISLIQIVLLLGVGRLAFNAQLPHDYLAFSIAIVSGMLCFTALGVAISSVIPNQDAAGPIIGIVYFVLLFLSGLWFPLTPGSVLAKLSSYFPVRHLILAVFAPFKFTPGASAYSWHDIEALAIWFVIGLIISFRRFRWEPRRP